MQKLFSVYSGLSRGQRWFLGLLAVFVLVPFSALVSLQLYNAATLAVIGTQIVADEDLWKEETRALNANVDAESLKSPASRHAYRLLSHHDEMVPERRVVVTFQEPLGTLKTQKNQAAAEDTLLDKAASRIQSVGEAECALLIGSLARECTVMSATGRPVGSKAYEYQLQLAFLEKNAFGKSDQTRKQEFVISRSSPGKAATGQRVYFEKAARQRQRIYQDVAETCASIRKKAGNCSVTGLSVATRLDRGTPMVRITASAAYASLVATAQLALAEP